MCIIIDNSSSVLNTIITIGKRSKTVSFSTYVAFFAMVCSQGNEHMIIDAI